MSPEDLKKEIEEQLFVAPEISIKRLDSCKKCPKKYFNSETSVCNKCGCLMLKKTKLKTAKCPIGEW